MSRLPVISSKDFIKAMKKLGWEFDPQKESHIILRNIRPPYRRLSVTNHKEIAKGTLRSLLRNAGIEVDMLIKLLNR